MKKVLVVDDFFNFRLTLKNMLRSFGIMYIDDAATGEEAVRKLAARRFDIVLCDYNLGQGKSGQQVLEEARHRGYISHSSIFIMVTAENTMEMILGAVEYEPDDYLMKPFAKEVLEKKIKSIAAKKENIRDIEKAIADSDFDHAVRICDELQTQSPSNLAEILKLKGEALIRKNAFDDAIAFFDGVLKMGNLPWARLGRARAQFLMGDYEAAREAFEALIAQNNKIMSAYDYLAKIHIKLGDPREAQQILAKAITISPLALLRHKELGHLAYRNEDYTAAESSFRTAVKQGKHSCFKSASDYTQLAKTMVWRDAPEEGLQILTSAAREFPDAPDTRLQMSATESFVYTKMNKPDEAKRALASAHQYAAQVEGDLPADIALDFAQACLAAGDVDKGKLILTRIVGGNHDDDKTLESVRAVFKETGMADIGERIIEETTNEIIHLNNEGVKLAKEGQLKEAIDYFTKAASRLPDNKIINANTAQVIMLYMRETGNTDDLLEQAAYHLERVRKIDPHYSDIPMLLNLYRDLTAKEATS